MTSEEDWPAVRKRLADVAALAALAAEMDNVADAEPLVGLAMTQLMDASFWCGRLMRAEEPAP